MSVIKEGNDKPKDTSQNPKEDWSAKNLNGVYGIVDHGDDKTASYYPGRPMRKENIKAAQEQWEQKAGEGDIDIKQKPDSETGKKIENISAIQGDKYTSLNEGEKITEDSEYLKMKYALEKERAWGSNSLAEDLYKDVKRFPDYENRIKELNRETDVHVTNAQDILVQQDEKWKEPIEFLYSAEVHNKKTGDMEPLNRYEQLEVCDSFKEAPEVVTLKEDLIVYQYFSDFDQSGHYHTTEFYNTSEETIEKLALANEKYGFSATDSGYVNKASFVKEFTIPKGTTILKGTAGPNFSHLGGGEQIYVADPRNSLIE